MAEEPIIEVTDLTVDYGDYQAVRGVSFAVNRGELYALLGTNGAGKTSTLETVEGHRSATGGRARVFGHNPLDRKTVRPRTGIMLQESGFAPDLTVRETVTLIGKLSGRRDDVDRVLAVANLTDKRSTKVAQLSGGEKRRLDFATAIFGSPDLVFLDEPTTGLDIQARDALWAAVDELRNGGTTIVLTTHYLEEAQQRADRIALMHQGLIRLEGTVTELTAALPATIRLTRPDRPLPASVHGRVDEHGVLLIETQSLQRDLLTLLRWAEEQDVELTDLSAGPTSLDDVFRTLSR
ncbi:ABC transporter ATP-binding protein [Microbacterium marinilacus]|uniref:ABC transporter ATP-binding protein n=1 Tax=Microbacterium marinilacus TaxID=415209 RepID=A0ABP7BM11_9MICO|nr:ABC transporter ATP-binding protein [Microbacterium marinilacus]MBY0688822.1 ABC transporter ATP-binding protein [Microbacterium marinilacus]